MRTLVRLLQFWKAHPPILVTLSGSLTLCSPAQNAKADDSISVTPCGICTLVRLLQSRKANAPIFVTLWGMRTLFRLSQDAKAMSPTEATPSLMITPMIAERLPLQGWA